MWTDFFTYYWVHTGWVGPSNFIWKFSMNRCIIYCHNIFSDKDSSAPVKNWPVRLWSAETIDSFRELWRRLMSDGQSLHPAFYCDVADASENVTVLIFASSTQLQSRTPAVYFNAALKVVPSNCYQLFTVFVSHSDSAFSVIIMPSHVTQNNRYTVCCTCSLCRSSRQYDTDSICHTLTL